MWKNFVELVKLQMTKWRMRIDAGYPRIQRLTKYVILNALPLQKWLHERASVLRYTYIAWPALSCLISRLCRGVNKIHALLVSQVA
jgi:hypothetical protein